VCIKAVRAQDPTDLKKVESVCNSSLLSEVYSAHSIPDFSSSNQQGHVCFPSELASCHRRFGDPASVLHNDSVDA
jgi:hypothetical protein